MTVIFVCARAPRAFASTICYNSGDPTYSTATNEQVTICHNTTDEGLYFNTPQYQSGVQYGQIMYNVQSLRIAPNTYRTVLHTGPLKLFDSINCPLSHLAEPGWPTTPPPFPTYAGWVPADPGYSWCIVGDSIQEASYNATGPTDPTPYTMGATPGYVLWGSETNANAANFYGSTTNQSTVTTTATLSSGTAYTLI